MTPTQIQDALGLLQRRIGGQGSVHVTIHPRESRPDRIINGVIYPDGVIGKARIAVDGDDFQDVITKMNEAWNEYRASHQDDLLKRMALAIIRLTEERGECTDQMLRADFGADDVIACLDRATELADKMAANGPFKVVRITESNAA